jgi:hypothetical protein
MTRPYLPPDKARVKACSSRTGIPVEALADYCMRTTQVQRMLGVTQQRVNQLAHIGRRRHSELSRHKLPSQDMGRRANIQLFYRIQDVMQYALDWNYPIHVWHPEDLTWIQRGRVAIILTKGYDPIQHLNIINHLEESEQS